MKNVKQLEYLSWYFSKNYKNNDFYKILLIYVIGKIKSRKIWPV